MPANNPNPCSVAACEERVECRGYCRKHYTRWRRHGDPQVSLGPARTSAHVTYDCMHKRLRRALGRAAEHACVRCGGAARTWSYDHGDPSEMWDEQRRHPYSQDMAHYRPMCSSCHSLFDAEMSRLRG